MTRLTGKPPWRACLAIIRAEALKFVVDADEVIQCRSRVPAVVAARRSAVRRILAETSCSQRGLAAVWGIDVGAIRCAIDEVGAKRSYTSGAQTLQQATRVDDATERLRDRLRWAHGDARAAQIITGQDPKTNADLAAWKRLGGLLGQIEGRGN
jgi:hypothetical protein